MFGGLQEARMQRNPNTRSVEASRAASTVRTNINYVQPQAGRPLFHTSDPSRSRLTLDPHQVSVRDARALSNPSLDREGFKLIRQPLPALDFHDISQRDGPYLIQLQEVVKDALKADKVISNTSVLRLPGRRANQVAVLLVHCDFTPKSARRLLSECWDQTLSYEEGVPNTQELIAQSVESATGDDRRYRRVIAFNAWRPISQPPHDLPLAVCRIGSLGDADIQVADFIEEVEGSPPYQDELSLCRYNPRHEWFNFSDMTPDEVLLFIGYDYANPGKCGAMHTAFRDPTCPPGVPGRASIEVRMFAFFE
jgi:hypothetical protein